MITIRDRVSVLVDSNTGTRAEGEVTAVWYSPDQYSVRLDGSLVSRLFFRSEVRAA